MPGALAVGRGVAWNIAASFAARGLGLLGTLVLVRYVSRLDYGEVVGATLATATANQLSTLGVGIYLIAHPKAERDVVFHVTVLHLALGVVALGALFLGEHWISQALASPGLGRFLPGMALSVLIDRLTFVPERMLIRQLAFRRVAASRGVGEVVYTGVAVMAAAYGAGGMAIVWGNVARSLAKAAFVLSAVEIGSWARPTPLRGRTLRPVLGFGGLIYIGTLVSFALRRWDNGAVLHLFGPVVAGAYALAYNLADIPAVQVGEQVTDVLQASFARMEKERRRHAFLRAGGLLALVMCPLVVGLGLVAPTLVQLLFPRTWADLGTMLLILSVISFPRPIHALVASYIQIGRANRDLAKLVAMDVVALAAMMSLLFTVGRQGPAVACAVVGAGFVLRLGLALLVLARFDGQLAGRLLAALAPPALAALPMAVAVVGVGWAARSAGAPPVAILAGEVVAGAISYLIACWLLCRERIRELASLAKQQFRRPRQAL